MDKTIISHAYELAKVKYGKKGFTFENLWKELVKKLKLDKDEQKQAGHVYSSMLQDNRFIFAGNNQWKLREFLTVAQQKELSNALYDFKQEESEEKRRVASLGKREEELEFFYQDEEDELMAQQSTADNLEDDESEDEEREEESQDEDDQEGEDA